MADENLTPPPGLVIPATLHYQRNQLTGEWGALDGISISYRPDPDAEEVVLFIHPEDWRRFAIGTVGLIDSEWPEIREGQTVRDQSGQRAIEPPVC